MDHIVVVLLDLIAGERDNLRQEVSQPLGVRTGRIVGMQDFQYVEVKSGASVAEALIEGHLALLDQGLYVLPPGEENRRRPHDR